MVVRCAEEVVSVKSQAKSAATKFSERARAEKAALQAEIKQLQVKQQTIFLSHSSGMTFFFQSGHSVCSRCRASKCAGRKSG
jgi:hypothetical protein